MPKIEKIQTILQNFKDGFPASDDCKRVSRQYRSIVSQTKEFVNNSGFSDVVIGLSGGIDSALVAKIAVDAFGAECVHGLILPGPYSSQQSIDDAKLLANNLGIDVQTQMINSAVEVFARNLQVDEGDLTSQNIQARCRMIYIMGLSNKHNWLMLNTANKSEVYTGYSTLYGDMAGGYSPLGASYKTDVFKMCVHANLTAQRQGFSKVPIPQNIIDKPPSAELTSNQTDENSLGIEYPMLDAILVQLIDNKLDIPQIVELGFPVNDVQTAAGRVRKSEFKRRYEPPCPNINWE